MNMRFIVMAKSTLTVQGGARNTLYFLLSMCLLALVLAQEESGAYYSLQQDQDVAQEMCWALHRMILSKPSL